MNGDAQNATVWEALFRSWPDQLPRNGMLVVQWGETVPFIDFRLGPGVIVLERDKPDALGSRKVLVPYSSIAGLKLGSTAPLSSFSEWGFR